jgi:NADH-quinone oxidoreductase subunit J
MTPVFLATAPITLASALLCVTRRNPVYSAVWLLVCFLTFAVHYLALSAPFLAAIHVLVYTGAILVLFLFVIMLLNLKEHEFGQEYGVLARSGVALLCTAMFATLSWGILKDPTLRAVPPVSPDFGSVELVGDALFRQYGLAFELVSLLIVVAMFGAMLLAKKRLWNLPPRAPAGPQKPMSVKNLGGSGETQ